MSSASNSHQQAVPLRVVGVDDAHALAALSKAAEQLSKEFRDAFQLEDPVRYVREELVPVAFADDVTPQLAFRLLDASDELMVHLVSGEPLASVGEGIMAARLTLLAKRNLENALEHWLIDQDQFNDARDTVDELLYRLGGDTLRALFRSPPPIASEHWPRTSSEHWFTPATIGSLAA